MIFWLVAGVMAAVALGFAISPLIRKRPDENGVSRKAYDIAVYRDQLRELEAELKLGEISRAAAATARLEIERRILRAGQKETQTPVAGGQGRNWVLAVVLSVFIPALGFGLYLHLGSPDLPDHPFVSHENDKIPQSEAAGGQGATIEELVEKLITHLKGHPEDIEGWVRLREAMIALDEAPRAAKLMEDALATRQDDINLRLLFGESLMVMSEGQVTPAAKLTFEQVLKLSPHNPGAAYYLALAAFQSGNVEGAYKSWSALAANSPAGAPWLPQVRARLQEAAAKLGQAAPAMPPPLGPDGTNGGPTADQQASAPVPAPTMSPADRDVMIRGMVEKFADRLKKNPGDYEGWMRLGHFYEVLGDKPKALAAWHQAETTAPADRKAAIAQEITRLTGGK